MVSYSFQGRFAGPILAGTKTQTIRADRKRHARPGEELQLYTGMRTKHCRLVGRARCTEVEPVQLELSPSRLVMYSTRPGAWVMDPAACDRFAVKDGFNDAADMRAFWAEKHPGADKFAGVLIRWELLP